MIMEFIIPKIICFLKDLWVNENSESPSHDLITTLTNKQKLRRPILIFEFRRFERTEKDKRDLDRGHRIQSTRP